MVNHPEQQRIAQEELDRVVGRDRMPGFEDSADLPYINALVKEVQRWRPVIAGGLAHATTKDDVYLGYFIPKGTTVIPNAWAIHMDPNLYPQPEQFRPERFLKDGNVIGVPQAERGHFGFGYGRRMWVHLLSGASVLSRTDVIFTLQLSRHVHCRALLVQ
jgi:cytochrome P450